MNVSDVMTRGTSACEPHEPLERAAGIMWDRDCGAVPVVDATGALHGIVTDRDVAMSAYLKGRPLAAIAIGEVMSRDLHCCAPSDTLERALATMRQHQVHRMPVVDGEGRLVGMLAIADVLQATQRVEPKQRQPLADALVDTLAAVRRPRIEAPLPSAPVTATPSAASVLKGAQATLTPVAPPATPAPMATTAPTKPVTATTGAPSTGGVTPKPAAAPAPAKPQGGGQPPKKK